MTTNWRYWLDFLTMPIISLSCAALSPSDTLAVGAAALGYFSWVLIEWWFHAKLLHRRYRRDHWVHHLRPADTTVNEALPATYTHAIAALAVGTAYLLGAGYGLAFAGALVAGYASYIWGHHLMHHGYLRTTTPILGAAVRRHNLHHRGVEANYNVLCPLGDLLMGTFVKA